MTARPMRPPSVTNSHVLDEDDDSTPVPVAGAATPAAAPNVTFMGKVTMLAAALLPQAWSTVGRSTAAPSEGWLPLSSVGSMGQIVSPFLRARSNVTGRLV